MDHADHLDLLREVVTPGGTWADIGAGAGAFTLALAELVGPAGQLIAVDRDRATLADNAVAVARRSPDVVLRTLVADFTGVLVLPELDGLVAANSLHFVARDKQAEVVRMLAAHLRPGGAFVVVEYDAVQGNQWVPNPFRFDTWALLAAAAGLTGPRRLGGVPGRFLGGIYSAVARRPDRSLVSG